MAVDCDSRQIFLEGEIRLMSTVLAAVVTGLHEPTELREVQIPDPEETGVLARVEVATLCGTDVHHWLGELQQNAPGLPYIPGHETAAVVEEIRGERKDVLGQPLAEGDRIIANYPRCNHCYFCTIANQPQLCPNGYAYGHYPCGTYPFLLGGCAEMHYYPPGCDIVKIPPEVPSDLAASAACALRTVIHGFERLGGIEPHEKVLIQGAGPLGLYASALARDRGAGKVIVIGAPEPRLSVARDWGADATLNLDECSNPDDRKAWVLDQTNGLGPDVVIQCASGLANPEGLDLVRRGGRFLAIGVGGNQITLPSNLITVKGLQVSGVIGALGRHYWKALEFLRTRREQFDFSRLLTGVYTLDRVGDALSAMERFEEVKAVVLPHTSSNRE
jgi:L-iditol 2-dehydrogenase